MTNTTPAPRFGLKGNTTAEMLRVGDQLNVAHGRARAMTRVEIIEINRNGNELRIDYRTRGVAKAYGHVWLLDSERVTLLPRI